MSGPQGSFDPAVPAERPIDPHVRIGHVHLRTADIDRVRAFYVDTLGFDVVFEARDVPGWGTTGDILFVSAGGYHHHLGFNTWKGQGVPPQPSGVVGLRDWQIKLPIRADVEDVRNRVSAAGYPVIDLPNGFSTKDPWAMQLSFTTTNK